MNCSDADNQAPAVEVEPDDTPSEVTGVVLVDEHARSTQINETWEDNGCMPDSHAPHKKDFFKNCEITREKARGIITW